MNKIGGIALGFLATTIAAIAVVTIATPAAGSLLNVTDPSFDDNGPGNYAYPTSPDFRPGAFDIQQFQIFDDGTTIYFLLTLRDFTKGLTVIRWASLGPFHSSGGRDGPVERTGCRRRD